MTAAPLRGAGDARRGGAPALARALPGPGGQPERAARAIARRLWPGGRVLRARAMAGGSSARMTALEIALPRRRCFAVLRRCPAAWREARLLAALRRWDLPVPAPLHARRRGAGGPFVAMALLAGQSDYDPQDRAAAALQMAAFLARLHARAPAHRFSFLPRLASPLQLAGPERTGARPLPAARALLETAPVPAAAHGRCLLHGDFWPGNLLWREGKLAAVVDWEDAAIGDPLADVAIARCDLGWGFGLCAMALFTRRYAALTGFDLAGLPLWDIAAVLRQAPHAADYAEGWQELGRADVTRAAIATVHRHLAREAVAALTA